MRRLKQKAGRGTWDWAPPSLLVRGGYWVWAVRAAAWYFRHTQADPLLAASAAWASRRRLSLLPAPSLEKKNGRLLLGNPLHPTSKGKQCTFHPLVSHSCTRSKYFALLNSWRSSMLSSQGTVSSPMITTLPLLDHVTRSGLMSVIAIAMGKTNLWLRSNKTSQSFARDRMPLTGLGWVPAFVAPSLTKDIPVGLVLLRRGRALNLLTNSCPAIR